MIFQDQSLFGKGKSLLILVSLALFFTFSACAHVISKPLRDQVEGDLSFEKLLSDPEAYKGALIMVGGNIIKAQNLPEETLLEILQKPLDRRGRPRPTDQSSGRFLVVHPGYLDGAIYREGRDITIAGEVMGKKVLPLGEIEYRYPLLRAREIYLWEPRPRPDWELYYPYWHQY